MGDMKECGFKWIGLVPEKWEVCRIKDKYSLVTGFTPDTTREDFYDDENGYTWISIADMSKEGKNIMESIAKISDNYIRNKHPEIVKKGSLLYSFKLSVGKVGFAQKELYTNEAIACFKENENVCLEYLYYASFLIEENANINIYGAKILNQDLINNSVTLFPLLIEQKLIVDFLDEKIGKIDEILYNLQKQVEILQKYKKLLITEIVTKGITANAEFKKIKIGRVVQLRQGLAINAQTNNLISTKETSLPLLRIADMNSGTKEIFMEEKTPKQYIANKKDLIYTRTGQVGLIFRNQEGVVHNNCFRVIPKNEDVLTREYLYWTLKSDKFYQYANMLAYGSAQPDLSHSSFKLIEINVFLKEEQLKIANFLNTKCTQIDEIIKDKQTQIDKMEKYKKSLIYEYVTGKKRVKGAEELYV